MAEELSDWKVHVTLDRKAIRKDIAKLEQILARERIYYTVAARSRDEAIGKTKACVRSYLEVPTRYVKSLSPRRLPT